MAKTRIEHIGTGVPQSVTVYFEIDEPSTFYPYGYLHRDHIYVFDENQNPVPFTWNTGTGNTITVAVPLDFVFYVQRIVPRDELYVDWSDGAILHDRNLAAAHLQHLMIVQEIDDGFIFGIEDPDTSLLPSIFRSIKVPDEVTAIRKGALLTPQIVDRAEAVFTWDVNGDIGAIPFEKFFGVIGQSNVRAGYGIKSRAAQIGGEDVTYHDVNPGRGLDVVTDLEGVVFLDNPLGSSPLGEDEPFMMKGNDWIVAEAKNIPYDTDNTVISPEYNNVQDAMRILALYVLALTAGVRFRGAWDAANDLTSPGDENIEDTTRRTGDYWKVSDEGSTPLLDPDGNTLDDWNRGQSVLWVDYDDDDNPSTPNTTGWLQLPVAERLPADNIDIDQTGNTLPATSQAAHEEHSTNISNILAKTLIAGLGLDGGGDLALSSITFNVGAGAGILVAANSISVEFAGDGTANTAARSDHFHTIVELSDTVITTPAVGQTLEFDGAVWKNVTPDSGGDVGVPESRLVTAGAGLAGGGNLSTDITLDVGAGPGITVDANAIKVNFAGNGSAATAAKSDHTHTYGNPNTTGSNANGWWWKCGDTGMIHQWGTIVTNALSGTVTLPVAFGNTSYVPQITVHEAHQIAPGVTNRTQTSFAWEHESGDQREMFWTAVGLA